MKANTRRMPLMTLVLACLACDSFLSADPLPRKPSEKAVFKGMWDGKYRDNDGTMGLGSYQFDDKGDGLLKVVVSWKDGNLKSYEMNLEGKRLGIDAMYLEGKYKDTTYRYMGRMNKGELMLQYLSIDEKTGKSGSGVSALTRPK
jgi:hypothetical protein